MKCQYFLNCNRKATTTVPNPILGDAPCCQKCKDFYDGVDSKTKKKEIY